jgi:hypothetical protein
LKGAHPTKAEGRNQTRTGNLNRRVLVTGPTNGNDGERDLLIKMTPARQRDPLICWF